MPITQAAGAGMSCAEAARSNSLPAAMMTTTSTAMAASALGACTSPLRQRRAASGTATRSASAPERAAAAINDVVLMLLEPDPQRQAHQPLAHRRGHRHLAVGAAVFPARRRVVQGHIVEYGVHAVAAQP